MVSVGDDQCINDSTLTTWSHSTKYVLNVTIIPAGIGRWWVRRHKYDADDEAWRTLTLFAISKKIVTVSNIVPGLWGSRGLGTCITFFFLDS